MNIYMMVIALLSMMSSVQAEIPVVTPMLEARQDREEPQGARPELRSMEWTRLQEGAFLGWDDLRRAHTSGLIRAVVTHDSQAFDRQNKQWIGLLQGTELRALEERCTGWMNGFLRAGYREWNDLYVKEWDIEFLDTASGHTISSELVEGCHRPSLTRDSIVTGQREGLVQAFTNKSTALMGNNGALIYVGPRFRNREQFDVEWLSRSTSGILRIAANRQVILENEPCRPFSQVKIQYAGGTFLIRAVDLDIRLGGQNLSKTPLGPAFSLFCD